MAFLIAGWFTLPQRRHRDDSGLEPPVPHLLESNQTPTRSEAAAIHTAISQAEQLLSQLNENRMRNDSKALAMEKDHIVQFIQAERAIMSPLRSLPAELLAEIFTYLVHEEDDPHWNKPPFVLTQICHRWRDIALSLPHLWRRVPKLRLNEKSNTTKFISSLQNFLARSSNSTLMFAIYAPYKEYYSHPVLDVLIEHSDRWENVSIHSATTTVHGLYRAKGKLPRLRKLKLEIWPAHTIHFDDRSMDAFVVAPMLTDISLSGIVNTSLNLPWGQITRYEEQPYQSTAFGSVLTSTELKHLRMVLNFSASFTAHSPPVRLNSLQTIDMDFKTCEGSYAPLIASITAPSLQHVRVASYDQALPRDICSLALRSGCSLQTLAIHNHLLHPGHLSSLLRETPLLLGLEVSDVPKVDIRNLIFSPGNTPLVPLLRSLILRLTALYLLDPGTLSTMARSRCGWNKDHIGGGSVVGTTCHRLESLRVVAWGGVTLDLRDALDGRPCDIFCPLPTPQYWPEPVLDHQLEMGDSNLISLSYAATFVNPGVSWSKYSQTINKYLSVLEDYTVDSSFFTQTHVHLSLHDLTQRPPQHIPGERKYRFRRRAQIILDKWKPALLEHLESCHWAFRGRCCLIYVASDDEVRKTPQALENIIFGVDEQEIHSFSLLWPSAMR